MPSRLVLKTKYDWEAMYVSYLGDCTLGEIAEMYEVPYDTVRKYASDHYWMARRAAAKEKALSITANKVKARMERARLSHQNHMLDQIEETQHHIAELEIKKPGEEDETRVTVGHKLSLIQQHDNIARKTLGLDDANTGDPTRDGYMFLTGMAKAARDLVNENRQQSEGAPLEDPQTIIEVDAQTTKLEGEKEPENTSSAIGPLPAISEPNAAILGPFNGHSNGQANTQNTPIQDVIGQPGAPKPLKVLPKRIITSR